MPGANLASFYLSLVLPEGEERLDDMTVIGAAPRRKSGQDSLFLQAMKLLASRGLEARLELRRHLNLSGQRGFLTVDTSAVSGASGELTVPVADSSTTASVLSAMLPLCGVVGRASDFTLAVYDIAEDEVIATLGPVDRPLVVQALWLPTDRKVFKILHAEALDYTERLDNESTDLESVLNERNAIWSELQRLRSEVQEFGATKEELRRMQVGDSGASVFCCGDYRGSRLCFLFLPPSHVARVFANIHPPSPRTRITACTSQLKTAARA